MIEYLEMLGWSFYLVLSALWGYYITPMGVHDEESFGLMIGKSLMWTQSLAIIIYWIWRIHGYHFN